MEHFWWGIQNNTSPSTTTVQKILNLEAIRMLLHPKLYAKLEKLSAFKSYFTYKLPDEQWQSQWVEYNSGS